VLGLDFASALTWLELDLRERCLHANLFILDHKLESGCEAVSDGRTLKTVYMI